MRESGILDFVSHVIRIQKRSVTWFELSLFEFTRIYLDCLLGVKGEPWLICPRLSAVLPFTLHVSTRFLGGSASNCPADPLMPPLITSSSSSHAGLLRFLSSSRKYITFSVLWLREHSDPTVACLNTFPILKPNSKSFYKRGVLSYFGLSSSWMSLSRSLKQPRLAIACSTSGSIASTDGITCVCTTSIIDSSNSNSPLPAAVTQICLFISAN